MPLSSHRALQMTTTDPAEVASALHDRAEVVDAVYRFALGQDRRDADLLASAFAADAELDFRPAAARRGGQPPVMTGREAIVTTILDGFAGRVATTHQVTNPRVVVEGDSAHLTALVEAQHLLTTDRASYALLKNPYDVRLVRHETRWVIRHMRIDNAWFLGDPLAIFGG